MAWREVYPILVMQFFPLIFAAWRLGRVLHWFGTPLLIATSLLNLSVGLFQTWVTYRCISEEGRPSLRPWFLVYGLFALVYTTVKTTVTLVAQYGHLRRDRAWMTTPRPPPPGTMEPQEAAEPAQPADRLIRF